MTDKKILDAEQKKIADEILSDNEIDKVAGGDSTGKRGPACAADNVPVMFDPKNVNVDYGISTGK